MKVYYQNVRSTLGKAKKHESVNNLNSAIVLDFDRHNWIKHGDNPTTTWYTDISYKKTNNSRAGGMLI